MTPWRPPCHCIRSTGVISAAAIAARPAVVGALGHVDDHALPGGHLGKLLDAEPFLLGLLEGELREQVLTHQPVLQLTGLGELPNELLAVLDSQRRIDRQSRLLGSGGLTPMLPVDSQDRGPAARTGNRA